MIIGVAGPYSAETEEQRQQNLDNMNKAATRVLSRFITALQRCHMPVSQYITTNNTKNLCDRRNRCLIFAIHY